MRATSSMADRFWAKVSPEPMSGCWLWEGAIARRGYGVLFVSKRGGQRNIGAHRYSLMLSGVTVPADAIVLHKCDNAVCVNPDHLRVGTQSDNMRDMIAKGRHREGRESAVEKLKGRPRPGRAPRGEEHHNFGNRNLICQRGHPMEGSNVMVSSDGRRCRTCHRERSLRHYHSKKGSQP